MADVFRDLFVWAQNLSTIPKVIASIVLVLLCALALFALWGQPVEGQPTKKVLTQPQQKASGVAAGPVEDAVVPQGDREFTNRTARQLLALYEGRTPFQADKLMDPYPAGNRLWEIGHVIGVLEA